MNSILQSTFEITTKLNIYWRKLMWNCETRGRNSPATFRKITNIWSGWIFVLIFLQNQKRFWSHYIVFMLLNWLQRLDYQGDFEINISAIKNTLKKKIYIFFFTNVKLFSVSWNQFTVSFSVSLFWRYFLSSKHEFLGCFLKKMRFHVFWGLKTWNQWWFHWNWGFWRC